MPERLNRFYSWVPPVSDLKAWIAQAVRESRAAAYWSKPTDKTAAAGVGAAFEAREGGTGRFGGAREALETFWAESRWDNPDLRALSRAFSVFAFSGTTGGRTWHGLPRNWTWVPAKLAVQQGGSVRGLALDTASTVPSEAGQDVLPPATSRNRWDRIVSAALNAIASGQVEKVVLARSRHIPMEAQPDIAAILSRLEARYPDCAVFCLGRNGFYFIGASPEPLVTRRESRVSTMALAGTAALAPDRSSGAMPAGEALLADEKNLREHAFVARALRRSLAPYCSKLDMDEQPGLLKTGGLLHLKTEFEGTLAKPVHILDLAGAIHPTPAVAGAPLAESLDLIARLEDFDRGWYAGPLGWIDPGGGGEFRVGLRSGLCGPGFCRLFAGCGVVEGSDAETEWWETDMKLQALASCLGDAP